MKKINEMMISAYLKGMSKLNAFKDNESGEVNMVAIVLIIIVVIALVAVFKDGISDVLSAAFKKIKDEKGAVPIVEATFIFPIVFFCMFFLIYIGMYILQSVLIYTQTQKVASIVSKSMAVTGYEKVGKHTADNVNFDFKDNKYFTQDSVNTIYDEKAKLYRYFYPDPIAGNSDIESINSSLTSLIDNLSIISGGGVTCDINAKNYFINQTVSVTIKREGAIPEVFSYIGMDGVSSDITVTATAASCDGAEFVRNTDMVYDFVTFLSDRLHISDKISYLKEKVQGVFQEDAKEAANAAG